MVKDQHQHHHPQTISDSLACNSRTTSSRPFHAKCTRMRMLITSIPSLSTLTRRRISRRTTSGLTSGTWISATVASVSTWVSHILVGVLIPREDIVDIKPVNMEELTEVITAAEFHPTHCNLFMYSSSKSNIKLADMRDSALCDKHAKSASLSCLDRACH